MISKKLFGGYYIIIIYSKPKHSDKTYILYCINFVQTHPSILTIEQPGIVRQYPTATERILLRIN